MKLNNYIFSNLIAIIGFFTFIFTFYCLFIQLYIPLSDIFYVKFEVFSIYYTIFLVLNFILIIILFSEIIIRKNLQKYIACIKFKIKAVENIYLVIFHIGFWFVVLNLIFFGFVFYLTKI